MAASACPTHQHLLLQHPLMAWAHAPWIICSCRSTTGHASRLYMPSHELLGGIKPMPAACFDTDPQTTRRLSTSLHDCAFAKYAQP